MTSNDLPHDFCPYKGLEPYTEEHRDFFFGRERDQKTIISNLHATSLTILYGASGVGKSSVLMAGVVPHLRETLKLPIVVFRNWHGEHFLQDLKQSVLKEIALTSASERVTSVNTQEPFDIFLAQCIDAADNPIFFVLDQFEEYFLYHAPSSDEKSFDAQFARAVNRRDVEAKFLLSMREEGLSKLDRFRGRIPNILGNTLRLNHLDRSAAIRAVCEPVCVYNERVPPYQRVEIETSLIGAVLRRSRQDPRLESGQWQADYKPRGYLPIATPILQMLMTRLWGEEHHLWVEETAQLSPRDRAGYQRKLRYRTLKTRLKGAESVLLTYLDKIMDEELTGPERDGAARISQFLVTPEHTKIAQSPATLAEWAGFDLEEVRALLQKLSAPRRQNIRILRNVPLPGQRERYEITHDVLGVPLLNWRREFIKRQDEERIRQEEEGRRRRERAEALQKRQLERARWMRRGVVVLSILLLAMMGLLIFALRQRSVAVAQRAQAEKARKELEVANGYVEAEKLNALAQESLARISEANAIEALKKEAAARKVAEAQTLRASEQARIAQTQRLVGERAVALAENRARTNELQREGTDLFLDGQYREAIEKLHQSLAVYQQSRDFHAQAKALITIGGAYDSLGEKQNALHSYQQALALFKEANDELGSARALNAMGEIYTSVGERGTAVDLLQRALKFYEASGDSNGQAATFNNLSTLYKDKGDLESSLRYLDRALIINQANGNRSGEADTFVNMGALYVTLKEWQKALGLLQQAVKLYRDISNRVGEAQALNKIGAIYDSLGDNAKAKSFYQQANDTLLRGRP